MFMDRKQYPCHYIIDVVQAFQTQNINSAGYIEKLTMRPGHKNVLKNK